MSAEAWEREIHVLISQQKNRRCLYQLQLQTWATNLSRYTMLKYLINKGRSKVDNFA